MVRNGETGRVLGVFNAGFLQIEMMRDSIFRIFRWWRILLVILATSRVWIVKLEEVVFTPERYYPGGT